MEKFINIFAQTFDCCKKKKKEKKRNSLCDCTNDFIRYGIAFYIHVIERILHDGAKIRILSSSDENNFTNKQSKWIKNCFHYEKIKLISSSHRVIFFLLYRFNAKPVNVVIDILLVRIWKICHWLFSSKTLTSI